jgi:allantoin racemase
LISMRIHLAVPITGLDNPAIRLRTDFLASIARSGTEITYSRVREGPPAIESSVDHTKAAAEVLKLVGPAEAAGADAIIIWCAGDPGLEAARTLVDVPVVGPGEAMRLLVQPLGRNPAAVPAPLPVLELRVDAGRTLRLTEAAIRRLQKQGYDSFYLDCLGMFGMGRPLREATKLPVVDPAEASLELAETMAHLRLTHSRAAYPRYPPPHRSARVNYNDK